MRACVHQHVHHRYGRRGGGECKKRRRRFADRGGSDGGVERRQSERAGLDVPHVAPGDHGGGIALVLEHILRVSEPAAHGDDDIGSGGDASHRALHGEGSPAKEGSDRRERIFTKPWALQHKGARADFDIRECWCRVWERFGLCRWHCGYNTRVLWEEDYLLG